MSPIKDDHESTKFRVFVIGFSDLSFCFQGHREGTWTTRGSAGLKQIALP
jgi:hypothetical protein